MTFTLDDFSFTDCITCGVRFAMPKALYDHQVKKGGYHHCPNGHSQGWSKEESEFSRLKRERDSALQQIARAEDEAREAKQNAAREVAKAQAETKRLRKRTASGTCPCCQRTFSNMSIHMRKQHPEFVAEVVVKPKLQVVK